MVSDQEIANGVENLLRQSDPNAFTSLSGVVQHLEAKLGLDLSHKAGFIRDQIELLLRSSHPQPPPPQPQPPPKDHFALQHHPQFQSHHSQIPPHFALQQQQHHHQQQQQQQHQHQHQHQHRHHEELNFQLPPPQHPNPHPHQHPNHPLSQTQPQQQSRSHPQPQKNAAPDAPKESAPAKRRGGAGGLNKVCGVSPELQAIVGEPTMPRTEIVKQLWAYIRKNNLQDPSNKRKIICNDELRLVFETDCTDMFKMNKLLSKHIIRLEPLKEPGRDKKRVKLDVEAVESASESTEAGSSLLIISDALANFFGSGGREMLHSEALSRVWEYIQVNRLQDPMNSSVIKCDAKLHELFGCESISPLGVTEMVEHHLFKPS